MEKRCKNCGHFDKFKNVQGDEGLCRGVPPEIIKTVEGTEFRGVEYETRWPIVSGDDDWCIFYFNPADYVADKKES